MANLGALLTSDRPDWCTPSDVLQLLHAGWPEGVALDPCSNPASIVHAELAWTEADNALGRDWFASAPGRLVYVNPPYGRALAAWAKELERQEALRQGRLPTPAGNLAYGNKAMVALVPARTDTLWFRDAVRLAHAVIFLKGRLRFLGADAGAPFPSALIYYGGQTKAYRDFTGACLRAGAWIP